MTSFADELKELALTAPKEKDTEDVFNEESNAKLVHFDDTYEDTDKKRAAEILTQGRYKGKNVSRREMFSDESDEYFSKLNPNLYEVVDHDDDDGEDDDGDDDDGEDDDDREDFDADDLHQNGQEVARKKRSSAASESYSEEDSEDEQAADVDFDSDDPEADDEQNDDADDGDSEVIDCDISTHLKSNEKFDQLEESVANKVLNNAVSEEVHKGRCIANQMKIWDKLLEYRIQFQRILTLANQLPPCDVFKQMMKGFLSNSENARLVKQSVRNIERAFEQLAEIRSELIRKYPEMRNSLNGKRVTDSDDEEIFSGGGSGGGGDDDEEIPSDIASGYSEDDDGQPRRKKAKVDEKEFTRTAEHQDVKRRRKFILSERAQADEEFHRKFIPFRNAVIDKWYQRTKLASGKTGKGYTALEQPPVKQIEHILENKDRLLERTQIKRSQYKIIGLNDTDRKDTESGKQLVAEIFDDDDFYHHLLREVIERKTQDISDPLEISRHWIEIQKLRTKIKRKIDTKASKGRRIRYDVISKLVSFMTPHDSSSFTDQAKDELFSSIFGKRLQAASKSDSKAFVSKKDLQGFRLFK